MANALEKVYDKNYYHMNKDWGDGYKDYENFESGKRPLTGAELVPELTKKLKHIKKPKVLDVGCAFGTLVSKFPNTFDRYGTDISEYAISQAKKHHPKCTFKAANISEEIPFKQKFDLITGFDVFEHVTNLKSALENASAMMTKDSLLVIEVPVATRSHQLFSALHFGFLTNQFSHLTLTTPKAWEEIILPDHFKIIEKRFTTFCALKIPGLNFFSIYFLKKK